MSNEGNGAPTAMASVVSPGEEAIAAITGTGTGTGTGTDTDTDGLLEINVKTMDSKVYTHRVDPAARVSSLKDTLASSTAISTDRQRLIFRGRVLEDESAIGEYGMEGGNTMHMIARPANYAELQTAAASSPGAAAAHPDTHTDTGPSPVAGT